MSERVEYHRHADGQVVPGEAVRCIDPNAGAEDVLVIAPSGLGDRYFVRSLEDPTGKHEDCRYFVLDPKHDPIAHNSIAIYANDPDCSPELAADLWALLAEVKR